jgi:hypothetical protein
MAAFKPENRSSAKFARVTPLQSRTHYSEQRAPPTAEALPQAGHDSHVVINYETDAASSQTL